jgi:hypothetical protein
MLVFFNDFINIMFLLNTFWLIIKTFEEEKIARSGGEKEKSKLFTVHLLTPSKEPRNFATLAKLMRLMVTKVAIRSHCLTLNRRREKSLSITSDKVERMKKIDTTFTHWHRIEKKENNV